MTAKSSRSGHALYLEWDGVDISEQFLAFDPAMEKVTVDSTAGQDTVESVHVIRNKCAPTGQVEVDTSDTTMLAKMKVGETGTLIWGPAGNGAGNERWGIDAVLVKCNIAFAHGDRQIFDCAWMNTARTLLYDGTSSTF